MKEQSKDVPTTGELANYYGSPQSIRAGEAYVERIKNDPISCASFKRAQERLRLFSELVRAINDSTSDTREQAERDINQIWQEYATQQNLYRMTWKNNYGEPYPESLVDLDKWVSRLIAAGNRLSDEEQLQFKDILPKIEGHLLGLQDKCDPHRHAMAEPIQHAKPEGWSKIELYSIAEISASSFDSIRKRAHAIAKRERGGSSHDGRYSELEISKLISAADEYGTPKSKSAATEWAKLIRS
tara:strand:+ start:15322 stop:16047 length:726 start_codon:yes stop_codon:yes gene_type:complete